VAVIFTLKKRRAIDRAIFAHAAAEDVVLWRNWVRDHPAVRCGPADPLDDGTGPMPERVVEAAVAALNDAADVLDKRSEVAAFDEVPDLANDALDILSTIDTLKGKVSRK
jgi:hypothetical protein